MPCIVVVLHFYAAIQPFRPLIKRRQVQLKSTLTLQLKCLWVNVAADRIWTSTGGQHARIGGRFYNACETYLLDFATKYIFKGKHDICIDLISHEKALLLM